MTEFRRSVISAILFLFLVVIFGCGKDEEKYTESRFLFNTLITITLYSENEVIGKNALKKAFEEIERIDKEINNHTKGSDIDNINSSRGQNIKVHPETINLLERALLVCRETKGKFDITISPVFELWGFEKETQRLPDNKDLTEKLKHVNYNNIVIEGNKVQLKDPETKIEAGSFLKGYALYNAGELLKKEKIKGAFISATSTIVTVGSKPKNNKWKIAIQNPDKEGDYLHILEVEGKSVGVAGDYQTFIEVEGKRYHHILDPATGYPITGVRMVVLICDNGYTADMYDTAIFAMGLEEGMKLMKEKNLDGMILDSIGKIHFIGEYEKYISKTKAETK